MKTHCSIAAPAAPIRIVHGASSRNGSFASSEAHAGVEPRIRWRESLWFAAFHVDTVRAVAALRCLYAFHGPVRVCVLTDGVCPRSARGRTCKSLGGGSGVRA